MSSFLTNYNSRLKETNINYLVETSNNSINSVNTIKLKEAQEGQLQHPNLWEKNQSRICLSNPMQKLRVCSNPYRLPKAFPWAIDVKLPVLWEVPIRVAAQEKHVYGTCAELLWQSYSNCIPEVPSYLYLA